MDTDEKYMREAIRQAKKAYALCQDAKAPGWSGIGCRELYAHLCGSLNLSEARDLWLKNTRAYAKRQITWFRGRHEAIWLGADDLEAALRAWDNFCTR